MPLQKLLNRAIISGSGVSVADRDRKELEELFAGRWTGARDDGWSCERWLRNYGKFGVRHLPLESTQNGPLLASHKRGWTKPLRGTETSSFEI